MSAENNQVCCNCRHCIRERNEETLYTECHCEISGVYLSYQSVMGDWCRHWAKEQEGE